MNQQVALIRSLEKSLMLNQPNQIINEEEDEIQSDTGADEIDE